MSTDAFLPAFWHAAARLAGQVDFLPLRPALLRGPVPPSSRSLSDAGLSPRQIAVLRAGSPLPAPGSFLTMVDVGWSAALSELTYAPPLLFTRGQQDLLQRPAIAIVGSRRCTGSGKRMARRLACEVLDRGGVVVSGLAHGIDQAAHEASLGDTIAVLGQGLDAGLTARQSDLAHRIVQAGGLLVTEFLPTTHAARWTFPQRNRIIAGLSQATIVVEANHRSGALITARQALALGREVLAVPGSPLSPTSAGCLDLIADGAALARDGDDLDALLPRQQTLPLQLSAPRVDPVGVPALDLLLSQGTTVEQVSEAMAWPLRRAAATLTALELTGRVQRLPGDRFVTSRPD